MADSKLNIIAALQNLPQYSTLVAGDISNTRLGGLTNLVYRVDTGKQRGLYQPKNRAAQRPRRR